MPPWLPAPGHAPLADERRLTETQIDTLARWADGGAPEGDRADLPERPTFASGWQRGAPDLIVKLTEPFEVPAGGPDLFRNFILEVPVVNVRFVQAVEIRPGSPAAHHGILQLDLDRRSRSLALEDELQGFGGMGLGYSAAPNGHLLAWTPGKRPSVAPSGMAWHLHPGSDFILQLHLTPTGKPERVQPEIGLYFTDEAPTTSPVSLVLYSEEIDIAAGDRGFALEDELRLPVPVDLLGLYPHAHYLCKTMEAFAELPSGESRTLLAIETWDFDWQDDYRLQKPMQLPAGTRLRFRYLYDNSDRNSANPNVPPRRVQFGQTSTDEMGTLTLTVVPKAANAREHDEAVLALDEAVHVRAIQRKPHDWDAHRKLGRVLLDKGALDGAVSALREALRLRPEYPDARVDLGSCFLATGQLDAAQGELLQALAAEPRHARAHLQLARVLAARSDRAAAEERVSLALQHAPNLVEARVLLGTLLAQRGRAEEALVHFERALSLRPSAPEIHNNVATAHFELGHLEEARVHYTAAVKGNPNYFNAWFNLGRVQGALGHEAESESALQRAREINPRHPGLR
jgi:tetratricopeptide (TPR) repeat protein